MASLEVLNSLCFMCFKPAPKYQSWNSVDCAETKFLLLLSRHLNIHLNSQNVTDKFLCCEDCTLLGKNFCDLLFQLEYLKLQLNWKLQRICDTMVCAGRVPSRFSAFRKQFEEEQVGGEINHPVFLEIQEMRRNLIKQCKLKLKPGQPKVRLERIPNMMNKGTGLQVKTEKVSPKKLNKIPPSSSRHPQVGKFDLMAALVSYVAVLHLSLPLHPTLIPTPDYEKCHTELEELMSIDSSASLVSCDDNDDVEEKNPHEHISTSLHDDNNYECESEKGFEGNELSPETVASSLNESEGVAQTTEKMNDDDVIENWIVTIKRETETVELGTEAEEKLKKQNEKRQNSSPILVTEDSNMNVNFSSIVEDSNIFPQTENASFVSILNIEMPLQADEGQTQSRKSLRSLLKCSKCSKTFTNQTSMNLHANFHEEILTPNEHYDSDQGENLTGEEKMDGDFEQEVNDEKQSDAEMMECCESEVESSSSSSQDSSEDESHLGSDDNILRGRGRPRLHPFQKVINRATPRKNDIPPTECEVCQAKFSCEAAVEKHRVVDHKLDKYRRCHPCGKLFKCHRSLRIHRKTVKECFPKNPNDLKPAAASFFPFFKEVSGTKFCPEEGCYEVFQYDEGLNIHLKTHGNWSCNFCPAEFSKAHDFADHELSEHKNEAVQNTSYFKTHARNMVGVVRQKVEQNPLACTRCDLRYQGKRTLVEHFLLKHLDIYTKPELNLSNFRRQCHICKKPLAPSATEKMMKRHIKSQHGVEGMDPSAIARCTICEAPFTLRLHLTNHMLLVHNQSAYKCPHCDKQFRMQGKLSQHLQNAHNGKPSGLSGAFQCEICNERFQAEYLLKIHSVRHKEKQDEGIIYKCESCPRTFSKKHNLQYHTNYMHKPAKKTEILTPNEHDDTAEGENLTGEEKMDGDFEQEVNNEEHSDAEMMECCESEVESSSSQDSSEDESRLDSDDNILRGRGRPRLHPFQKVTKLATPRKKDIPPTECEVCQAKFSCEAAVEKHRVVDHKLDKYRRCHPCGKMFKCHRSLRNHRKTVKECFPKNPNDLKPAAASLFPFFNEVAGTKFCPEEGCYEVFQYDEGLNVHLKTHGNWRCNFCPAEFNKAHDFASHELSEHTNEAAQSMSFLKTHAKNMVGVVRQKVEQNPLACTRCDLRYQGKRTLVEHFLLKHLDISTKPELNLSKFRRQCHICKKTFAPSTTQKMMKNHIKSEHDVEGMDPSAIARCTICEAPFTLRLHLTNHMLLVHNQLAYKCPHCNKQFRIQGKLSQHLQNAHKGKPSGLSGAFQCEICKERFQAEYLLKIHSLRHKKIPDESIIFKCESCPRTFSKKQNLQGHVNYMHKPVKKTWHCDQCEKVFKTQTKLLQHTSYKHTDPSEWKFQCPEKECGKKCWSKQKLAEHIRTHTKECLFVCDFCGQAYRYRQYLRTHLAKVHGPSAAKTLPTQRYTKPFDQELNEKKATESDGADCESAAESSAKQLGS